MPSVGITGRPPLRGCNQASPRSRLRQGGAALAVASEPERRPGQDRADDRADGQAAQECGSRPVVVAAHVLGTEGPRIATADASRSRSRRRPRRPAGGSPRASRTLKTEPIGEGVTRPGAKDRGEDDDQQAPAGRTADEHIQRSVEDAHQDGQDQGRVEAHAPDLTSSPAAVAPRGSGPEGRPTGTGRAIRPPPSTTSPS